MLHNVTGGLGLLALQSKRTENVKTRWLSWLEQKNAIYLGVKRENAGTEGWIILTIITRRWRLRRRQRIIYIIGNHKATEGKKINCFVNSLTETWHPEQRRLSEEGKKNNKKLEAPRFEPALSRMWCSWDKFLPDKDKKGPHAVARPPWIAIITVCFPLGNYKSSHTSVWEHNGNKMCYLDQRQRLLSAADQRRFLLLLLLHNGGKGHQGGERRAAHCSQHPGPEG